MANKPLKTLKFPGLNDVYTIPQLASVAPQYSANSPYAVGDLVSYENDIYKCTTKITKEAWNASHWTQVTVATEIKSVRSDLDNLDIETDKTLAVADKPADSKTVGDLYNNIENALISNVSIELEQGTINSDGSTPSSPVLYTRVRFKDFIKVRPGSEIQLNISSNKAIYFNAYYYKIENETEKYVSQIGKWVDYNTTKSISIPDNATLYKLVFSVNSGSSSDLHPEDLTVIVNGFVNLSERISLVENNVSSVQETLSIVDAKISGKQYGDLINGSYDPYGRDGFLRNDRLIIKEYIPVFDRKLIFNCGGQNTFKISIWGYESPGLSGTNLIGWTSISTSDNVEINVPDNINYIRFTLAASNLTDDIILSDVEYVEIKSGNSIEGLSNRVQELENSNYNYYKYAGIEQGGFDIYGRNTSSLYDYRLRSKDYLPIKPNSKIRIFINTSVEKTLYVSLSYYAINDYKTGRLSYEPWTIITNEITFNAPSDTYYIRVLIKISDTDIITPSDIEIFINTNNISILDLALKASTYLVTNLFNRVNLDINKIGDLTYLQSFCRYNDKYYSTDGSNIGVQSSDFTAEQTVELNVGHGNSMQVGKLHPNYAYISGWDVQKIFVVNLDTLTLVEEINLPTTGYTTCAVDDVSGIAYIFQRDSYPTTEEYYNYIAYDYVNSKELYRKKTGRAFAAMQSCDFCEGKIIVLNGLGTTTAPDYILMYNTSGDIIGEFFIPSLSAMELEGISIDKDDMSLYVSVNNKSLYRITRKD